jgi:hypothetical protein
MTADKVIFSGKHSPCFSLGRNGWMQTIGLDVQKYQNNTMVLSPINSKGSVGRSEIHFPLTAIPELIKTLEEYYKSNT